VAYLAVLVGAVEVPLLGLMRNRAADRMPVIRTANVKMRLLRDQMLYGPLTRREVIVTYARKVDRAREQPAKTPISICAMLTACRKSDLHAFVLGATAAVPSC
jgi:hypothetical protein